MAKIQTDNEGKLTAQQELFARLYTQNEALFGNATLSYAESHSFDLDKLSRACPDTDHSDDEDHVCSPSKYDLAYQTCSVNGSRALRNAKVQARVTALLNEMLRDEMVDSQLAKLILQDSKPEVKIAAIREYNKIRNRIIDRIDHTTGGEPISGFNYITPANDSNHPAKP